MPFVGWASGIKAIVLLGHYVAWAEVRPRALFKEIQFVFSGVYLSVEQRESFSGDELAYVNAFVIIASANQRID